MVVRYNNLRLHNCEGTHVYEAKFTEQEARELLKDDFNMFEKVECEQMNDKLMIEDAIRGARCLLRQVKSDNKNIPTIENERKVSEIRKRLSAYGEFKSKGEIK